MNKDFWSSVMHPLTEYIPWNHTCCNGGVSWHVKFDFMQQLHWLIASHTSSKTQYVVRIYYEISPSFFGGELPASHELSSCSWIEAAKPIAWLHFKLPIMAKLQKLSLSQAELSSSNANLNFLKSLKNLASLLSYFIFYLSSINILCYIIQWHHLTDIYLNE